MVRVRSPLCPPPSYLLAKRVLPPQKLLRRDGIINKKKGKHYYTGPPLSPLLGLYCDSHTHTHTPMTMKTKNLAPLSEVLKPTKKYTTGAKMTELITCGHGEKGGDDNRSARCRQGEQHTFSPSVGTRNNPGHSAGESNNVPENHETATIEAPADTHPPPSFVNVLTNLTLRAHCTKGLVAPCEDDGYVVQCAALKVEFVSTLTRGGVCVWYGLAAPCYDRQVVQCAPRATSVNRVCV